MSPEAGPSRWQAAPFLPWPADISHADAKWRAARRLAGVA